MDALLRIGLQVLPALLDPLDLLLVNFDNVVFGNGDRLDPLWDVVGDVAGRSCAAKEAECLLVASIIVVYELQGF